MPDVDHVFVYGTLRRAFGHPMHDALASGTDFVGGGQAPGLLVDLGPYPGLWPDPAGPGVRGELYRLRPGRAADVLRQLDAYEGVRAGEVHGCDYRRVPLTVRTSDGAVEAWVYVLRRLPPGAEPIAGGDYLTWMASP